MTEAFDTRYGIRQGAALTKDLHFADMGFALPLSVPASGTLVSSVIYTGNYKLFALGAYASGALSVSVQRYLDVEGAVVQGAALTGSVSAAGALNVNNTDGLLHQAVKITFTNSGTAAVTLSLLRLILRAM